MSRECVPILKGPEPAQRSGIQMGVAVLLKQVPDTTAKISVSGSRVDESAITKWSISPYDEYALESAIALKESGAD